MSMDVLIGSNAVGIMLAREGTDQNGVGISRYADHDVLASTAHLGVTAHLEVEAACVISEDVVD